VARLSKILDAPGQLTEGSQTSKQTNKRISSSKNARRLLFAYVLRFVSQVLNMQHKQITYKTLYHNFCIIVEYCSCSSPWAVEQFQANKLSHYTPRRRLGERRYSSYSFSTSALDRGEWSASRPSRALPRGNDPQYPLYRRLGGPQSPSGHRG
jgi:hypothetical protein